MANIARMNVQLTAGVQGFITGMKKAGDSVERFAKKSNASLGNRFNSVIGGLSRGISRLGGPLSMGLAKLGNVAVGAFKGIAVGATAAATALGYMLLSMVEAIGDSADMAKRLGLSYNRLKTIQYAAKLAGMSSEDLSKAFEKMQDVLGSASMGNKAAIDSLARIGLTMEQLDSLRPEQRFEAIANAINRIQDPAQRIAAARDIFGKQGGALLVLFQNAGEAMTNAATQMERLGIALSDLDVANAEAAGDAIDNFKTALEGVATQLAVHISPYIQQLWYDTEAWIDSMGGIGEIVDSGLNKLADALDWIMARTDKLVVGWQKLARLWDAVPDWVKKGPAGKAVEMITGMADDATGFSRDVEKRRADREEENARGGGLRGWARRADQGAIVRRNIYAQEKAQAEKREYDAQRAARRQAAEQQRAAEIMERARARGVVPSGPLAQANRSPFVNQSSQGGGMGEQVMLLRQIASNTGKPNLAYAG